MDVNYINPFLSATLNVLKTMASLELTSDKPFLKKDAVARGDVSGVIGITGEVTGSLSVSFSFGLIKEIIKNMLGEDISEITDDVRDAVGEITNMICGDARRMLQESGLSLSAAIPTIVAGKNHTIRHAIRGPIIVIPFHGEKGTAVVEVSMDG
ncbi:MAG: chemotaxis protein CheX [Deltaproteobacteria bacterium]|nr:chemotaxis protein CheX [Deltaproteobacteria bacterium]